MALKNTLILALGKGGHAMAEAYRDELRKHFPGMSVSSVQFLHLVERAEMLLTLDEPECHEVLLELVIDDRVLEQAKKEYAKFEWSDNTITFSRQLDQLPRWRGQLALLQHLDLLQSQMEVALAELFGEGGEHSLPHATNNHALEASDDSVEVFILLDLADLFMTGTLPDLPYLIRHYLSQSSPQTQVLDIHLVVGLPSLDMQAQPSMTPQEKMQLARDTEVCGFACLAEIDHFFGWRELPARFQRTYPNGVILDQSVSPLGLGRVFIIETSNEKGGTITSAAQLEQMVGSWLYAVTMTPLHAILDTRTAMPQTVYSSFGHGGFEIPFALWVERTSNRLQVEFVNAMLPLERQETAAAPDPIAEELMLTQTRLKDELAQTTRYGQVAIDEQSLPGSFSLSQPITFLEGIQRSYTNQMKDGILYLRGELSERRRQLMRPETTLVGEDTLPKDIEGYILELADETSGIEQAQKSLRMLYNHLAEHQAEAKSGLKELEQDAFGEGIFDKKLAHLRTDIESIINDPAKLKRFGPVFNRSDHELLDWYEQAARNTRQIARIRGMYRGYSQIAGSNTRLVFGLPFILSLFSIPLVLLFVWQSLIGPQGGARGGFWPIAAIIGPSMVLLGVMFQRAKGSLLILRGDVLRAYDNRLSAFQELELQRALIVLYDDLFDVLGVLRRQIDELATMLTHDIRQPLLDRWRLLRHEVRLCEDFSRGFIDSVLTMQILDRCETHVQLRSQSRNVSFLREHVGTPRTWYQEVRLGTISTVRLAAQIRSTLQTIALEQSTDRLRDFDMAYFMTYLIDPERRSVMFDHQVKYCYPYIRLDITIIPSDVQSVPYQWVAARRSPTFDPQAVFKNRQFQFIELASPYELFISTARHDFPLLAARTIGGRYAHWYFHPENDSRRAMAHARPEYVCCPDIGRVEAVVTWRTLPPYVLSVLVCSYDQNEKSMLTRLLQISRDDYARRRWEQSIRSQLVDKVKPTWDQDSVGNQQNAAVNQRKTRVMQWADSLTILAEQYAATSTIAWLDRCAWELPT